MELVSSKEFKESKAVKCIELSSTVCSLRDSHCSKLFCWQLSTIILSLQAYKGLKLADNLTSTCSTRSEFNSGIVASLLEEEDDDDDDDVGDNAGDEADKTHEDEKDDGEDEHNLALVLKLLWLKLTFGVKWHEQLLLVGLELETTFAWQHLVGAVLAVLNISAKVVASSFN